MKWTVGKTIVKYFKTSTLNGFKYLVSCRNVSDLVCWAFICVASACCAVVLCVMLWGRFVTPSALLTVLPTAEQTRDVPHVTICQDHRDIANSFLGDVANNGVNGFNKTTLLSAFAKALEGKEENTQLIRFIDDLIRARGYTLLSLFLTYAPQCKLLVQCRFQNVIMPCKELFMMHLTVGGICCTTRNLWFTKNVPAHFRSEINIKLELMLNCRIQPAFRGCKLYTTYRSYLPRGDELTPVPLEPGRVYWAELRHVEEARERGNPLPDTCIVDNQYSEELCRIRCIERFKCKCKDPIFVKFDIDEFVEQYMPNCRLEDYRCLKMTRFEAAKLVWAKYPHPYDVGCKCLPSCTRIVRKMTIQTMAIKKNQRSIDPLMSLKGGGATSIQNDSLQLNASQSVVLSLVINRKDSKILAIHPTETWVTLLASWGGVFNMFLGVGLFGVLEFLLLLSVKLLWQLAQIGLAALEW